MAEEDPGHRAGVFVGPKKKRALRRATVPPPSPKLPFRPMVTPGSAPNAPLLHLGEPLLGLHQLSREAADPEPQPLDLRVALPRGRPLFWAFHGVVGGSTLLRCFARRAAKPSFQSLEFSGKLRELWASRGLL